MSTSLIKAKLKERRDTLNQKIGVLKKYEKDLSNNNKEMKDTLGQAEIVNEALTFIEETVYKKRHGIVVQVESIVNSALGSVYQDNPPKFDCDIGMLRNRSAIVPYIVKEIGGSKIKRQPDGFGGGVGDVVSLILRLVLLKASGAVPILIADEPFKFLGEKQVPYASMLLKELCNRLGIQTIVTTHHKATVEASDKSFNLTLDEDEKVQLQ